MCIYLYTFIHKQSSHCFCFCALCVHQCCNISVTRLQYSYISVHIHMQTLISREALAVAVSVRHTSISVVTSVWRAYNIRIHLYTYPCKLLYLDELFVSLFLCFLYTKGKPNILVVLQHHCDMPTISIWHAYNIHMTCLQYPDDMPTISIWHAYNIHKTFL